ncbi:peroxiredoxin [Flavobacterium sp. 20NA77.7]|uniref:thioredoxin-dependent peroxiredoxin n=1 Tax=Flavobacterium nakdongensis TaxID=3073563 RepID=A0ABY9RAW5_9FLAO|nr:peroxiredoxin [Flavobacterium sp. 20NA77.7]WMW78378.1 peroxiredoxin [Flavobacterium sp. 20NA77.7]
MAIQVGDFLPDFQGIDQNNQLFDSSSLKGKQAVIYFYPKDHTPGCTVQACSFRDAYQDFQDLGAVVVGVSSDSVASHQNFQEKHQLPFTLIADLDKKIRKLFGVPTAFFGLLPGRVTYVFDKNGKAIFVFDSMRAKHHIDKALEVLQNELK